MVTNVMEKAVKLFRLGMVGLAAVAMVAISSVSNAVDAPPPPQLVANLLDPMAHPAGKAGYGQKTDTAGKITASFLRAEVGPLNKDMVGKKVNVRIDDGPAIPVTVVLDKSGNNGMANLNLNSANGDKVPLVKRGSKLTVSTPDKLPIARGNFAPAK